MNTYGEAFKNCPVCEAETEAWFAGVSKCTSCGHVSDYSEGPKAEEFLHKRFNGADDYRIPDDNEKLRMSVRWEMVLRHAKGEKSLLDFGCANNEFIKQVPEGHGFKELVGFDMNFLTGHMDERKLDRSYDVITMWHTLEHLPEPGIILNRIPHKYVFLNIPWAEYLTVDRVSMYSMFSHGNHFHLYTRKSLLMLFSNYDLLEENNIDGQLIQMPYDIAGFAFRKKDGRAG